MKKNQGFIFIAVCIIALALAGCTTMNRSQPKVRVSSAQLTNTVPGQVTSAMLQEQVMRFADTYVAMISQASDDVTMVSTNSEVRLAALRWKLQQATAAYNDATGENPAMNALDLLVLTTMARKVVEDIGPATYGTNAMQPLLAAHINMESNAWNMADNFLTVAQQDELKEMIHQWRQRFPTQRDVGAIRFREFAATLGQAPQRARTSTSIFTLLYLNPLSGLDPTTAAIEGMRQLGTRMIFYTQRMPTLINWQAQLLAYELASQPESTQVLANMNQFAASAAAISKTSQELPQLINDQRQAAIQQIFDNLRAEQEKTGQLMTNTRLTLNSAATAASNINTAVLSLTAFVQLVTPTNRSPENTGTNSRPFDVLDYGKAASQIGDAAGHVNDMLATANASLPQIDRINEQFTDNANALVQRAFMLGLVLIIVLLAGSVVAGLAYRVLADKLARGGSKPSKLP